MLVVTRKPFESILIGDGIEVIVVAVHGRQVRLGIVAPKSVAVRRKEVLGKVKWHGARRTRPLTRAGGGDGREGVARCEATRRGRNDHA